MAMPTGSASAVAGEVRGHRPHRTGVPDDIAVALGG